MPLRLEKVFFFLKPRRKLMGSHFSVSKQLPNAIVTVSAKNMKVIVRISKKSKDYRRIYNIILCKDVTIQGVEPAQEAKRALRRS